MTEDPRKWLRNPNVQPGSYEELIDKLTDAEALYEPGGASEMRRLIAVFGWCRDNGFALSDLEVTKHFAKYQTASAYSYGYAHGDQPRRSKVKAVREIIARITSENETRRETEEWARGAGRGKPLGHRYYLKNAKAHANLADLADQRQALVITGPRETITLVHAAVKRYAEWDWTFDELLSDVLRGERTEE
jgi:hypothetical protein